MIRISIRKRMLLAEGETVLVLDAELPAGSLTALYGQSGSGKTTILKIIAGLVQPDEGFIEVNGCTWLNTKRRINMPPQRRSVGFAFQDYALFPNMTVLQNLQYAAGRNSEVLISEMLTWAQLEGMASRKPDSLSGGQRQRAALLRAIIKQPEILLLDEPLSALDHDMRVQMRSQMLQIHQEQQRTTLLVSHEVSEIYHLASRVLHLHQGQIVAAGTPQQLFGLAGNQQIQLTGEIINITADTAEILIGRKVIELAVPANQLNQYIIGQKVNLLCNAADIIVQKLS